MTTIYLINNGLTMNLAFDKNESLESKREKRILSIEGELESQKLAKEDFLQDVNRIYSSNYVMCLESAKYLATSKELDIEIKNIIGERVLGNLGDRKIRMVQELQENDFDYKLYGGESLNDVKKRMLMFLDEALASNRDKKIAVFTHNVAITALLSEFCEKGFNLDNRLILNYHDLSIVDGTWTGIRVIEMVFMDDNLVSIKRIK